MDPDQTAQMRRLSAQAGLDPCWSQMHYVGFVVTGLICFVTLLINWAGIVLASQRNDSVFKNYLWINLYVCYTTKRDLLIWSQQLIRIVSYLFPIVLSQLVSWFYYLSFWNLLLLIVIALSPVRDVNVVNTIGKIPIYFRNQFAERHTNC
jgi:hypothetical protein